MFQPKIDKIALASGMTAWKKFYGDIGEELPPVVSLPLGRSAHTTCFVDANHAVNIFTRILHTGFLISVTNASII